MSTHRILKEQIDIYRQKYPILAITGPRQAGKTTFLKTTFPDYRYITLENPDIRAFALNDPNGFLAEYDEAVILDEVQRAPELFSYLQTLVDQRAQMGRFILSGSQNFHLMQHITQSLAGRVGIFRLFPFDLSEMKSAQWLSKDLSTQLVGGFYPAVYDRAIPPIQYFSDYLDTYIFRDIRELQQIQDMDAFHKLIRVCASQVGQLTNYNELSKLVGVSHTTIRQWISLLKTSYILFELPPYFENFQKRLVKSPKFYFYDTGLLCRMLDYKPQDLNPLSSKWGQIFENMVVAECVKQNAHLNLKRSFYFWRDSNGHEVDLLYRESDTYTLVEIKSSKTIKMEMFKELDFLEAIIPDAKVRKVLIYGGDTAQKRTKYQISPWHDFLI
ncbi:MAG: ATP-binding protein [Chitinophagales bacterium]|jgi:hypothetical protein|nr:ATP-binding protein [Chitinophagales bacterium]